MIDVKTLTRLTPEQREHWDTQGYLVLPGVLSPDEIERLSDAVDRLDEASQRGGRSSDEWLSTLNVIEEDDAFLDLIDHPNHLGIVMDLMGATIQLLASQVMVRPPTPHPGSRWHYDGPKPYPFPSAGGLTPLLHLKIGWFLTDVDAPDMGNFLLIPGSHRGNFPRESADADDPRLAQPVPGGRRDRRRRAGRQATAAARGRRDAVSQRALAFGLAQHVERAAQEPLLRLLADLDAAG